MERPFLLFSGQTFYPNPAWEDLRGASPTLEHARALLALCQAYGLDWYQIVDSRTRTLVEQGALTPGGRDVFTPDIRSAWTAFVAAHAGARGEYSP